MEAVRCHAAGENVLPSPEKTASLRAILQERLTDSRDPRGVRHSLPSLVSVLVMGIASGFSGPLAIAQAAKGWDQELLAAHGCRRSPVTGLLEPPSASTLTRLPALIDADELEAALTAWLAPAAMDPQVTAAAVARAAARAEQKKRRRKPAAAWRLRETREDGTVRAAPHHPWLDPAMITDSRHAPARAAVAVDGKERKNARAGGKLKVHLLAAVTHVTGLVIGQDKDAKAGKANEITHFRPLLEPLPLEDAVVTADGMQTTRDNALWLRKRKKAHYLFQVLGNQPGAFALLDALPWPAVPVAAATVDTGRGRIETRTIRVLPVPAGTGFCDAAQAVLIERYVTIKKNGQWQMRNCEAVLYITSLTAQDASPEDLLALARGHWIIEHTHWLRDVIWNEDKSLPRTGNASQVMYALTNLVITLFRLQGVTGYTEETRRNAQNPRRTLRLLTFSPG
jgi:predicted transposase YbfD/YdcC